MTVARFRNMFSLHLNSRCHSVRNAHYQQLVRPPLNLSTHLEICFLLTRYCVTELQIFFENRQFLHSLASEVE